MKRTQVIKIMINKLKTILKSKGLFQSLLAVFGNIGATGISAISIILISRSLGPTSFGEFSVGFSLTIILSKINDLGLTFAQLQYIPKFKNLEKQNRVFSYVIKTKLVVSTMIASLGFLLVPKLSEILNFDNKSILYLAFFSSIILVLFEQLLAMLQSLHLFFQSVLAAVTQAVIKLFSAAFLVVFSPMNTILAFFAYVIAPIFPLLLAKKFLPPKIKINLLENHDKEKKELWSMAVHSAIGFIALGIIDNIDVLFVQKFLNSYETGLLGGVSRIAMLFTVAAYSLSTVLNARVARYEQKSHLIKYLKKAIVLALIIALSYFLILPFSKYAILLTVGTEYIKSKSVLNILLAASFISIMTTPFAAIFFAFKKMEWYFSVGGIIQLILIITGNVILVPILGVNGAAWARVITKIALFVFTIVIAIQTITSKHFKKNKETIIDLNNNL